MTDIDIDAIRERERVILPGPWRVGEMVPTGPDLWQLPILLDREGPDGPDTIEVCAVEYETGGFHYPHADAKADAEFVAHARTDIPALLDRLDLANAAGNALRNSVDALTAEVAGLRAELAEANAEVRSVTNQLTHTVNDLAQARNQAHRDATDHQQIVRAKNELANERDALKAKLSDADLIIASMRLAIDEDDEAGVAR